MSTLLLVLAVLGYAPPSQPTPETVTATANDLKQGWLCVDKKYAKWKGQKLTTGSTCTASAEEGKGPCDKAIALKLDTCWLASAPVTLTGPDAAPLIVKLPEIPECPYDLRFEGDILNKHDAAGKPPSPYDGTLYYEDKGHLVNQEVKAGKLDAPGVLKGLKTKLLRTDGVGLCLVDTADLNAPLPPTTEVKTETGENAKTPDSPGDRGVTPDLPHIKANLDESCWLTPDSSQTALGKKIDGWRRRRETICMAMDAKGGFTTVYRPRYLLPGQQLRLIVHVPSKVRLQARQDGTIGGESELDNQVSPTPAASQPNDEKKASPAPTGATIQTWTFEGRAPGLTPIIIEEEPGKEAYRLELNYPRTYLGSIRVGFGVVGGGAVGPQYTGVQRAGSSTYEIIGSSGKSVGSIAA